MFASQLAKRLRMSRHLGVPLDVVDLASQLEVRVRTWPTGIDGIYMMVNGERYVVVDSHHRENGPKWRCIVAHELGHVLCLPEGYKLPAQLCKRWSLDDKHEREAFEAAFELLMPARETRRLWQRAAFLPDLADRFNVTTRFARSRIAYLCEYGF